MRRNTSRCIPLVYENQKVRLIRCCTYSVLPPSLFQTHARMQPEIVQPNQHAQRTGTPTKPTIISKIGNTTNLKTYEHPECKRVAEDETRQCGPRPEAFRKRSRNSSISGYKTSLRLLCLSFPLVMTGSSWSCCRRHR